MVGEFRKCEIFSGFLYGVSMLLTFSVNCSGCGLETNILNQSKTLADKMQLDANKIFNESFTEHGIPEEECEKPLDWFPKPNLSHAPTNKLLNAINQTLINFTKVFKVLLDRHTGEYKHTDKLQRATKNIEALRSNMLCLLKMETNTMETDLKVPNNGSSFQQQLECCRLLNIYKDFVKNVHTGLQKIINRRRRSRRKTLENQMTG